MKKLLLIFSLVAITSVGYSQIKGGLKGGLNFANADIDATGIDPDSKTGYHAGFYLEIGLAGFNIMPEVLYSFKGTDDLDFSYLEVPILFKKDFAKVLNIHLGPQFGFLLNADSENAIINAVTGNEDIKDSMASTEVSGVVGLGFNVPGGLGGGVRYVLGFNDVWNNDLLDTEIKNNMVQVYLSYKLFGD